MVRRGEWFPRHLLPIQYISPLLLTLTQSNTSVRYGTPVTTLPRLGARRTSPVKRAGTKLSELFRLCTFVEKSILEWIFRFCTVALYLDWCLVKSWLVLNSSFIITIKKL